MRKFLLLIWTCWYMALTAGATVQLHYCMGKLRQVVVGEGQKAKTCVFCAVKKDDAKNSCCHDEAITAKLTTEHGGSLGSILPAINSSELFLYPAPFASSVDETDFLHLPQSITPLATGPLIYIVLSCFRC